MKFSKQKALGITLTLQLLIYCVCALLLGAASKKLNGSAMLVLSCISAALTFAIPCLTYTYFTKTPVFRCITVKKSSNNRTRNLSKNILTFIIAVSLTVTAVNIVGALTDLVASLFGISHEAAAPTGFVSLLLTFIRSVILAAFFEELLFRGIVLNAFESTRNSRKLIISALLFALMHYNLLSFFYAFVAGAILSYFAIRTGSVVFTMLVHLTQNLTVFIFSVLRVYLEADVFGTASSVSFVIFAAVAVLGTMYLIAFELKSSKKCSDTAPTENHNALPRELIIYIILAAVFTILNF